MNIYRNIDDLPSFRKTILTIGSFDGVHLGHQSILRRMVTLAKEIGGESVVVTFYPHPRNVVFPNDKKIFLLNSPEEKSEEFRKAGIDHLVIIPFSVEFSQLHPREYIEKFLLAKFNPEFIVLGYDHKFGLNRRGDISMLKNYEKEGNFKVIEINAKEIENITISSTRIRQAIENGDVQLAYQYLGYPYRLTGKVVYGDKLGTSLGYPTANLKLHFKEKLLPLNGVYAVKVNYDNVSFDGMMYIGTRASVSDSGNQALEVHMMDFSGNIYGRDVTVEFIEYIREDIKFEKKEQLVEQIQEDEKTCREILRQFNDFRSSKKSKISVVILNFNGREYLESFLPSIAYSNTKEDVDIVVIDNNSSDDSVSYIKEWHPEIKTISLTKNYGFADGYNKGLLTIDTEYIVLLNSDVMVTTGWLDPIIDMMEADPTIGVTQPLILSLENKKQFEYAGAAGGYLDTLSYPFCRGRLFDDVEEDTGQYQNNTEIFWSSGAAMVIKSKLYQDLGGFDPMYFAHHEEIDLCWRAKRAGYKIMACGESKVYHLGGGSLSYQSPFKMFLNFRNNLFTLVKNESMFLLVYKLPIRLILDGIAAIHFMTKGQWTNVTAVLKAHGYFYISLFKVIATRHRFTQKIFKHRIGPYNSKKFYKRLIIWDYFILGRKKFSDLKSDNFE
ncbi:MAG: bifunctional riboflavin kinase/FAD synthetase [Saprospiraceae bacterium]|nr:bifunctional riboflavin kinase/FAD synthetase [Saprospiraceae bacterium]MBK6784441.1 bifunctional riboflavin kinase/FAD synthetase [Saprospiraceae bacterium]MBK8371018.1 bifunctional riboflavin kinase/FAD synthetase [Saprospiraceae bacterium]MBK8546314.1 bifunctional riboflavin kinase/FAD synthetase [Saprospiraceae bacterium]MBK8854352.1 bifunctional riboflavin kinase/FAD synthetase [Saprospiraceae bacterium]